MKTKSLCLDTMTLQITVKVKLIQGTELACKKLDGVGPVDNRPTSSVTLSKNLPMTGDMCRRVRILSAFQLPNSYCLGEAGFFKILKIG